jgi:hypothetical protein
MAMPMKASKRALARFVALIVRWRPPIRQVTDRGRKSLLALQSYRSHSSAMVKSEPTTPTT